MPSPARQQLMCWAEGVPGTARGIFHSSPDSASHPAGDCPQQGADLFAGVPAAPVWPYKPCHAALRTGQGKGWLRCLGHGGIPRGLGWDATMPKAIQPSPWGPGVLSFPFPRMWPLSQGLALQQCWSSACAPGVLGAAWVGSAFCFCCVFRHVGNLSRSSGLAV